MAKMIATVVVSLAAGLAAGAWLVTDGAAGSSPRPTAEPATPALEERLLSLEQALADERDARLDLEYRLQDLVDAMDRDATAAAPAAATDVREARASRTAGSPRSRDVGSMMRNYEQRRLDRLTSGGFSEDEARRVLQKESAAEYRAMQMAWDAQRTGERVDPLTSLGNPQALLRAELGDSEYERFLEAQGYPTSVQVTRVLDGSPGRAAGLQPGDQLVSYDGQRIFNVAELREQTVRGDPGEDIVIEIDRDGVRMQLSVPRGPIGITGSGASIRSMSRWGGG